MLVRTVAEPNLLAQMSPLRAVDMKRKNPAAVALGRLCRFCDQPMRPKGTPKRPNEYDHAQGCPYNRISAVMAAMGRRGGKARAARLTPEERSENARKAGLAGGRGRKKSAPALSALPVVPLH